MDPNDALHRAFHRANVDARNGPQPAAIAVKWTCSDCGLRRPGWMREQCQTCGAEVCSRCGDQHLKQHPVESRR